MQDNFTEIKFNNENNSKSHFDVVDLEDVLKKQPTSHSQFEYHRLSFYLVLLFTEGNGKYNVNFNDYEFEKGSLFTVRRDNAHKFYHTNAKGVLLLFTENFLLDHSNRFEVSKVLLLFNELLTSPKIQLAQTDFEEVLKLVGQIKKEYLNVDDPHTPFIVRGLFQIILAKLFRIKSSTNLSFKNDKYLPLFIDFQELLEDHCFSNRKVKFYAGRMGITTKTLNKITQAIIHKPAKAYISETFIIKSKRLIINTNQSFTEIAYKVGFEDPSNFFKYFIKYAGISPSRFKKEMSDKG